MYHCLQFSKTLMNNIRFISVSCSYPTASSVVFSRNWKFESFAGLSELSRIFKLCKSLDSVEQVYLSPTGKRILNYQKNIKGFLIVVAFDKLQFPLAYCVRSA